MRESYTEASRMMGSIGAGVLAAAGNMLHAVNESVGQTGKASLSWAAKAALIDYLEAQGRPTTPEELVDAMGLLKSGREGTLENNILAILRAKDRRLAKNRKRAGVVA